MTPAGTFYLSFGICGFILNIAVAFAIIFDKEMRNPTYLFMMNLAFCDAVAMIGIIGPPVVEEIWTLQQNAPWQIMAIITFIGAVGVRCGQIWLLLVAFSRWIYFAVQHKSDILFSRRRMFGIYVFVYIAIIIILSPFLFDPGAMIPLRYGGYAYTNSIYSSFLLYFDEIVEFGSCTLQILFNIISFAWIMKIKNQMTPELRTVHMQEVRLFVQCVVDSLVFIILLILGHLCMMSGCGENVLTAFVVVSLANFTDCAVLYLCFNKKLRSTIFDFIKKKIGFQNTVGPLF